MWKTVSIYILSTEDVLQVRLTELPRIGESVSYYDREGNQQIAKVIDINHSIKGDKDKYVDNILITVS